VLLKPALACLCCITLLQVCVSVCVCVFVCYYNHLEENRLFHTHTKKRRKKRVLLALKLSDIYIGGGRFRPVDLLLLKSSQDSARFLHSGPALPTSSRREPRFGMQERHLKPRRLMGKPCFFFFLRSTSQSDVSGIPTRRVFCSFFLFIFPTVLPKADKS